jgi:hypothetical protein
MADVSGKFFTAVKVRTGVSPSSPGSQVGESVPPVNPPGSGLNSVGLNMPSAFTVANSPLTSNGTIGVSGAGTVGQYIRGDGSLADFPESSGGGSSISYYLNGSVSQGTIGGVAYKELNKVPILGAGTDFTINADGYIASFLTDAGDPNLLEIPGGNWTFETYFSASSGGGSPTFYVELYKYDGTTFTLIASNSTFPELIAFGTNIISYFSTLAVPTTALALTDRLAIRYYVTHSGRTITLHTEDNHLCQIITTFTTGITALNGLTAQVQNFAVGTSGTDFAIASATATHTFNLPTASATNRGALSSADWTTFNSKQNALTNPVTGTGSAGQIAYFTGTSAITSESGFTWDATNNNLSIGGATANSNLTVNGSDNTNIFTVLAGTNSRLHIGTVTTGTLVYMRSQNNYSLNLGVNTSDYLTILSSGNVGVNTATPATAFEVNGVGLFSGTSLVGNTKNGVYIYDQAIISLTGGNSRPLQIQSQTLSIFTGTTYTEKLKVFENGNVVISTSPSDNGAKLQVNGDITISKSGAAYLNITSTDSNSVLKLNTPNSFVSYIQYNSSGNSGLEFYDLINSATRMVINSSGSVGISVNPSAWDNTIFKPIQLGASGSFLVGRTDAFSQTQLGANGYFDGSNWKYIISSSSAASRYYQSGGEHVFENSVAGTSGNNITWNTRFFIALGGSVGINNTSPMNSAWGTDASTKQLSIDASGYAVINLQGSTSRKYSMGVGDGSFYMCYDNTAARHNLSVTSSGNVMIGTTTDNGVGKLQVNGSITVAGGVRFSSSGADANRWSVYWNGGTGDLIVVNNISDIRAKKDFDYDIKGLETITKLKPLKFTWKDGISKSTSVSGRVRQYGFIAQETMQADDFLAWHNENHDTWGIEQYESFTAVMVKAIQELKQEIDTLKN